MTSSQDAAAAIAFFEACNDPAILHQVIGEIALRARAMIAKELRRDVDRELPGPAELEPAAPASSQQALAAMRAVVDLAVLQAIAVAVGRRIEEVEIAAAAEFSPGTRVSLPMRVGFPRSGDTAPGTVESARASMRVVLEGGGVWEGPPSLVRSLGVAP